MLFQSPGISPEHASPKREESGAGDGEEPVGEEADLDTLRSSLRSLSQTPEDTQEPVTHDVSGGEAGVPLHSSEVLSHPPFGAAAELGSSGYLFLLPRGTLLAREELKTSSTPAVQPGLLWSRGRPRRSEVGGKLDRREAALLFFLPCTRVTSSVLNPFLYRQKQRLSPYCFSGVRSHFLSSFSSETKNILQNLRRKSLYCLTETCIFTL